MNKRHLRRFYNKIAPINIWIFFGLFLAFSVIAAFALRQNNLTALELRDKVTAADKANKGTEEALKELREFTYSHMNADLSNGTNIQQPVQLKYEYERLVAKEKARVEKANEQIYTNAQKYCEKKYPGSFSGGPRVPCIANYVKNNGDREKEIPDALYKFDFVSPVWSPDLAGFSVLFALIFLGLFILRYILDKWLRIELHED